MIYEAGFGNVWHQGAAKRYALGIKAYNAGNGSTGQPPNALTARITAEGISMMS